MPRAMRGIGWMGWVFVLGSSGIAGCQACGSKEVPFGMDPPPQATVSAPASQRATFVPFDGVSLPDATQEIDVEGAKLSVPIGALRGALEMDIDGDGDRDVLAVIEELPTLRAAWFKRDGVSFSPFGDPAPLSAAPETCVFGNVATRAIAESTWVIAADTLCPIAAPAVSEGAVVALAPEVARARVSRGYWITGTSAGLEVRERFSIRFASSDPPEDVPFSFRVEDRDADGQADVVVSFRVGDKDGEWTLFDRPSGYALDTEAWAGGLDTEAAVWRRSVRRDPEDTLREASRVRPMFDVLCEESGFPRLQIGNRFGLTCAPIGAFGTADAIAVQVHARKGRVLPALDAWRALERAGTTVSEPDRTAAHRALTRLRPTEAATWWEGPVFEGEVSIGAHYPHAVVREDGALLLRGASPTVRAIGGEDGGSDTPADIAESDVSIRDGERRFSIAGLAARCEGVDVLLRASASGEIAALPFAPRRFRAGCERAQNPTEDPEGWRPLGWAPQGIVLATFAEARVLPLDAQGVPAGDATIIPEGTPLPAPLRQGSATPDGRAYAIATPFGILVRELAPVSRAVWLRPAEWPERWSMEPAPIDVSLSPDARRVAFLKDRRVYVLTRP